MIQVNFNTPLELSRGRSPQEMNALIQALWDRVRNTGNGPFMSAEAVKDEVQAQLHRLAEHKRESDREFKRTQKKMKKLKGRGQLQ